MEGGPGIPAQGLETIYILLSSPHGIHHIDAWPPWNGFRDLIPVQISSEMNLTGATAGNLDVLGEEDLHR